LDRPIIHKEHEEFDLQAYRRRMIENLGSDADRFGVFFEALNFAYKLHSGQKRRSGAPYISHPCAAAEILAKEYLLRDPQILAAAVLHDLLEDVPTLTIDELGKRFGQDIAEMVDGCTKMKRFREDKAALKDLTHRKILLSSSRRLAILVIKLADRLHNMRTLQHLPISKRQPIAQETLDVYAPLAAKLGIFSLKRELYRLALSHLYPKKSKALLRMTRELETVPSIIEIRETLGEALAEAPFESDVRIRVKDLGSYYDPSNRTFRVSNTDNRVDVSVIVRDPDPLNCYAALGIVNRCIASIPRSLRDFIANPKHNGYMSLHTRVHFRGENYLIKIRTQEMDRRSLLGVLAAWNDPGRMSDQYLGEIVEFLKTIGEYRGEGSQRSALIRLSEGKEITLFTPKGDGHSFPVGSTILDFAYKIHSHLGEYCRGALVNDEMVDPTYVPKDGDTVEVLTSAEPLVVHPNLETLCGTPRARTAINRALHRKRGLYAREIGREILNQETGRHNLRLALLDKEMVRLVLEILNIKDIDDLYARIGQDLISPQVFVYYFTGSPIKGDHEPGSGQGVGVSRTRYALPVGELDPSVHRFGRCCNPFPGEEGLVAILSERGVTLHRPACMDLTRRHDLPPQRIFDVKWNLTSLWQQPLLFHITVFSDSWESILAQVSSIPVDIKMVRIECQKKEAELVATINAFLQSFAEARRLFACFPMGSAIVEKWEVGSSR
jgi:GTP pyrophosphokinase